MVASKARKEARKRQLEQAKRDERRKKTEDAVFGDFEGEETAMDVGDGNGESSSSPKSKQKSGKKLDSGADGTGNIDKTQTSKNEKPKPKKPKKPKAEKDAVDEEKRAVRFIVFVGSLPFTATNASIEKHFAKIEPVSIRHATSKDTGKSRGFAFLEFDRYERMNDCLRLYHHSTFDDGQGGEPRRINIELTAGGGGGKSKDRKERIRAKNEKLAGERTRRAKNSKEKTDGPGVEDRRSQQKARPSGKLTKFEPTGANKTVLNENMGSIHPSRLARFVD